MKIRECLYNLQLLWENVAPRRCAVCGDKIDEGVFCQICREHFVINKMVEQGETINIIYLLYKYEREVRKVIHAVKFENKGRYLYQLEEEARVIFGSYWQELLQQYDLTVAIPTSVNRSQERGYEVPEEIFDFLNFHQMHKVLERRRVTAPLFNLNKEQREQEVAGCFKVIADVTDKRVLLLDDIYTTGATANEAAKTLLAAGAKYVDVLAFSAGKNNWN
ncbi:MAG: hypothetical protein MJ048_06510 [Acidaminococcaceae bacterium]|nr:hypothetical protein [Acidaminococcaceae bacterium]MDO4936159.1 hypothetical protein [Phascolarctobacterium sp.]